MEYRKYDECCRRCGEVFETDELYQETYCEKCQYNEWQEQEDPMEEVHA